MHSLNPGYVVWLAGSILCALMRDFEVFGDDADPEPLKLRTAWTAFGAWCKTMGIQYLAAFQIELISARC